MATILSAIGSSRLSNVVYFLAAAIYWAAILQFHGTELELTVQVGLEIVPFSAVVAVCLWAIEPDRKAVYRLAMWRLLKEKSDKTDWMAADVLFAKPWQSQTLDSIPIENAYKAELRALLQNPVLRDDIERLCNLFWVVGVSIPISYLFGLGFPLLWLALGPVPVFVLVGVVGSLFVSFWVLFDERRRPEQIREAAYCTWLIDLVLSDEARRKENRYFRQLTDVHRPLVREVIVQSAKQVIEAWLRHEWLRIDELYLNLTQLKSAHRLFQPRTEDVNEFIQDVTWWIQLEDSIDYLYLPYETPIEIRDHGFRCTISLLLRQVASRQIPDALSMLKPEGQPELIARTSLKELSKKSPTLDSATLLESLWPELLSLLSVRTYLLLRNVFLFNKGQAWVQQDFPNDPAQRPLRLIEYLIKDSTQGHVDPAWLFGLATKWNIEPGDYVPLLSGEMAKLLLERNLGLKAAEPAKMH